MTKVVEVTKVGATGVSNTRFYHIHIERSIDKPRNTFVTCYRCTNQLAHSLASRRTRGPIDNISFGAPIWPVTNHGMVFRMLCPLRVFRNSVNDIWRVVLFYLRRWLTWDKRSFWTAWTVVSARLAVCPAERERDPYRSMC